MTFSHEVAPPEFEVVLAANPQGTPMAVTRDTGVTIGGPLQGNLEDGTLEPSEWPLATIDVSPSFIADDGNLTRSLRYTPDPCEWITQNVIEDYFPSHSAELHFYSIDCSGVAEMAQEWDEENPPPPIALPVTELVLPAAYEDIADGASITFLALGGGWYYAITQDFPDGGETDYTETRHIYVFEFNTGTGELELRHQLAGPPGAFLRVNERSQVQYFVGSSGSYENFIAQRLSFVGDTFIPSLTTVTLDFDRSDLDQSLHGVVRPGDHLVAVKVTRTRGRYMPPEDPDDPPVQRNGRLSIERIGTLGTEVLHEVVTNAWAYADTSVMSVSNPHTGGAFFIAHGRALGYSVVWGTNGFTRYRIIIVSTGFGTFEQQIPYLRPIVPGLPLYRMFDQTLEESGTVPEPYGYFEVEEPNVDQTGTVIRQRMALYPYAEQVYFLSDDPEAVPPVAEPALTVIGRWVTIGPIGGHEPETWTTWTMPYSRDTCGFFLTPPEVIGAGIIRSPEYLFSGLDPSAQMAASAAQIDYLG